jgi:hypothetical protein
VIARPGQKELMMYPAPKPGLVLMQTGTLMPTSMPLTDGAYSPGWKFIENLDGNALDRDLRKSKWNFFFIAGGLHATAWGRGNENTARKATIKVLAKSKLKKFNCFEITHVHMRHFLGIPYVDVEGHSRHVQQKSGLTPLASR